MENQQGQQASDNTLIEWLKRDQEASARSIARLEQVIMDLGQKVSDLGAALSNMPKYEQPCPFLQKHIDESRSNTSMWKAAGIDLLKMAVYVGVGALLTLWAKHL